jgi:23S rRNA pseudouridine2457 synthase
VAHRYLLFNKPYDVLSQFTDVVGRKTLAGFIQVPDVYAAGRLDRDSEGLLLLSSDGRRPEHPRTYWAQVERVPDEAALQALREGVLIQGYRTKPAQARLLDAEPDLPPRDPPIRFRKNVPTAWIEFVLTEGRNRQVRHMTAAVGHPTLRLVRVAIGPLRMDGLAPGEWRDLTPAEIAALYGATSAPSATRRRSGSLRRSNSRFR